MPLAQGGKLRKKYVKKEGRSKDLDRKEKYVQRRLIVIAIIIIWIVQIHSLKQRQSWKGSQVISVQDSSTRGQSVNMGTTQWMWGKKKSYKKER